MPLILTPAARVQLRPDFTVLVDKAEKKDLPWPSAIEWRDHPGSPSQFLRIAYRSVTLAAGDLCIEGHERLTGTERKGSTSELWHNFFTNDSARFYRAIERLCDRYTHPILFLDFPISDPHPVHTNRPTYTRTSNGNVCTSVPDCGVTVMTRLATVAALYGLTIVGPLPSTTRAKTKAHLHDRRWAADFVLRLMLARVIKCAKREPVVTVQSPGLHGKRIIVPKILRRLNRTDKIIPPTK